MNSASFSSTVSDMIPDIVYDCGHLENESINTIIYMSPLKVGGNGQIESEYTLEKGVLAICNPCSGASCLTL